MKKFTILLLMMCLSVYVSAQYTVATFHVYNPAKGAVVGTVVPNDTIGQSLYYRIVSGNPRNVFAIGQRTGKIIINNELEVGNYDSFSLGLWMGETPQYSWIEKRMGKKERGSVWIVEIK